MLSNSFLDFIMVGQVGFEPTQRVMAADLQSAITVQSYPYPIDGLDAHRLTIYNNYTTICTVVIL